MTPKQIMTPKNERQKALLEELLLDYAIWWSETKYPSDTSALPDWKSSEESVPDEQPNEQIAEAMTEGLPEAIA